MALPVLDGNQSATTLSSVITGGEHIVAHTVVSLGSNAIANITSAVSGSVVSISNFPATQPISGSISISGTPSVTFSAVTISNFPASQTVAGTVTANVPQNDIVNALDAFGAAYTNAFPVAIDQTGFGNVPISGTVTVGNTVTIAGTVTANPTGTQTIAGTVTANVNFSSTDTATPAGFVNVGFVNAGGDFVPVTQDGNLFPVEVIALPHISGTVTANNPNGALTTRFGSVTTANTAQLTSAVTNTSRKYLLLQNIATSTVTIGIGFAPTTTQGIQLPAGGGLTFDAFCPTGGVWWLSSTTGSNFSILEG